jgi:hypothetical protein
MKNRFHRNYKIGGRKLQVIVERLTTRVTFIYFLDSYSINVITQKDETETLRIFADRAINNLEKTIREVDKEATIKLNHYDKLYNYIMKYITKFYSGEPIKENKNYWVKRYDNRIPWYKIHKRESVRTGKSLREIAEGISKIEKIKPGAYKGKDQEGNLFYFVRGEKILKEII